MLRNRPKCCAIEQFELFKTNHPRLVRAAEITNDVMLVATFTIAAACLLLTFKKKFCKAVGICSSEDIDRSEVRLMYRLSMNMFKILQDARKERINLS